MTFTLNKKEYSSTKAKELLSGILKSYNYNEIVSNVDHIKIIHDTLSYHPEYEEKTKSGIKDVVVVQEEVYKGKRFEIIKNDGTKDDFSFYKCFTTKSSFDKNILKAFWSEISDQIQSFKKNSFAECKYIKCPVTNLNISIKTCHVDHINPLTFNQLVYDFSVSKGLKLNLIKMEWGKFAAFVFFQDRHLAKEWQDFHYKNAKLRIILKQANLSCKKKMINWNDIL